MHHLYLLMIAYVLYPIQSCLTSSDFYRNQYTTNSIEHQKHEEDLDGQHDLDVLDNRTVKEICNLPRGAGREQRLRVTYLEFCDRYNLAQLMTTGTLDKVDHSSRELCERDLNIFRDQDKAISEHNNKFKSLLGRYNCENGYSVKWKCQDCKTAYKDWLCAINLTVYMGGVKIKPCISICERVEQRCPYLLPITKEQYGGQPVFICKDPNIPFVPKITENIPYSEPFKCYDLCHLSSNEDEIAQDSLSYYKTTGCPTVTELEVNVHNCETGKNKSSPVHDSIDNYMIEPTC